MLTISFWSQCNCRSDFLIIIFFHSCQFVVLTLRTMKSQNPIANAKAWLDQLNHTIYMNLNTQPFKTIWLSALQITGSILKLKFLKLINGNGRSEKWNKFNRAPICSQMKLKCLQYEEIYPNNEKWCLECISTLNGSKFYSHLTCLPCVVLLIFFWMFMLIL